MDSCHIQNIKFIYMVINFTGLGKVYLLLYPINRISTYLERFRGEESYMNIIVSSLSKIAVFHTVIARYSILSHRRLFVLIVRDLGSPV